MLRIFHVPSHLAYVAKLQAAEFHPVPPPAGRPLRVDELAALDSWDFFDVLHLHTVELATLSHIDRVATRATGEGKSMVFTTHDLVPNIETERVEFGRKTALAARQAGAVVTLTKTAAHRLAQDAGVPASSVRVVPHGAALPVSLIGGSAGGHGIAAFGALRPNRDLIALVQAWRRLPQPRPPLRLLLRSLSPVDRERYAAPLAELDRAARAEPELIVTTTSSVMPPDELASWCRQSSVLVLPYRRITHSGQLELARDVGLRVLAPAVPTLRAQLEDGPACPAVWFPRQALDESQRFAGHLQQALSLPWATVNGDAVREYRTAEHRRLLDAHHDVYFFTRPEKV